jgi:hypothetical protein
MHRSTAAGASAWERRGKDEERKEVKEGERFCVCVRERGSERMKRENGREKTNKHSNTISS